MQTYKISENFRNKLKRNDVVFGVFCKATTPEWIECIGNAGFDFVILDREHAGPNWTELKSLIMACELTNMASFVRVSEPLASEIGHSLDLGATGIVVPQVSTIEKAKTSIEAAKFAPVGLRGVCRFVRGADYSQMNRDVYFKEANKNVVVLQLEGTDLNSYEEFLDFPEIDVIFIGPYDLSQRLGLPGQVDHPVVIQEVNRLISLAKGKGKSIGIFADTIEQANRWISAGCQYIAYSVDVGIFSTACTKLASELNELRK